MPHGSMTWRCGPLAWVALRILRHLVYGLSPYDPGTLVAAVAVLMLVAILAAWIPARRAARVDPMEALRSE